VILLHGSTKRRLPEQIGAIRLATVAAARQGEETSMKLANPAPLGLSGFALTTWMLSMVNAGWYSGPNVPLVLASAFAFGGTAQFAAGLMEMPRGNTFGFVAFCSFGAFWWTFGLFALFLEKGVTELSRDIPLGVPCQPDCSADGA
jgi:succinate-acetate transporter protein